MCFAKSCCNNALLTNFCILAGGNEPRLIAAATKQLNTLPFYHSFWNRTTKPSLVSQFQVKLDANLYRNISLSSSWLLSACRILQRSCWKFLLQIKWLRSFLQTVDQKLMIVRSEYLFKIIYPLILFSAPVQKECITQCKLFS